MTKMKAKKGTKLEDTIVSKLEKFTTRGKLAQLLLLKDLFSIHRFLIIIFQFIYTKN